MSWLETGKEFPPASESSRLTKYYQNAKLFDSDHWSLENEIYTNAVSRINRVCGNFFEYICFPVLFSYQKLLALKTADLVAGEFPTITYSDVKGNQTIKDVRYDSDFDSKLYATVIDLSRFGDAIWYKYKKENSEQFTFCNWEPSEWFPIIKDDGTFQEVKQCLAWKVCVDQKRDKWELHVQVHEEGFYDLYKYKMIISHKVAIGRAGIIGDKISGPTRITTGLDSNAVMHLVPFKVTGKIYGEDDFDSIDSLVVELMTRMTQISNILDKHADPALTGPATMLSKDDNGDLVFKKGKFYAFNQGEEAPKYLTWDGQLEASFKQCEMLVKQLYVISEMGSALLGADDGGSQAISGNALRLKMVNPLAKVRRISNNLTKATTELISDLSKAGYDSSLDKRKISIVWKDGLPNDPREQAELIKLLTGETKIMPLAEALEQHLNLSHEEALRWIESIKVASLDPEKTTTVDNSLDSPSPEDSKNSFQDPNSIIKVNANKKGSLLTPHQTGTNSTKSSRT